MGKTARELFETFLVALVLALVVRTFVVESFIVDGPSMQPTLESRERLLVNKLVYRIRGPRPGEIIVFRYPLQPSRDFVKRVLAVGGETVQVKDGQVVVDGRPVEEPYIVNRGRSDYPKMVVPPGYVFVLGDNRTNSEDSRVFGFVHEKFIKGKAFLRWWPLDRVRILS